MASDLDRTVWACPKVIDAGHFADAWEFRGIGTLETVSPLRTEIMEQIRVFLRSAR